MRVFVFSLTTAVFVSGRAYGPATLFALLAIDAILTSAVELLKKTEE